MGGACQTGNERCLGGSNCFFGICECPLGTILESGKCILERKVLAGSPCNSTQICLGIANCIDGICQCPMGMVIQVSNTTISVDISSVLLFISYIFQFKKSYRMGNVMIIR